MANRTSLTVIQMKISAGSAALGPRHELSQNRLELVATAVSTSFQNFGDGIANKNILSPGYN